MHGPQKRAGGVACLEGVRTPSLVAKAVLENTDHHLIVGRDAQRSPRNMGFTDRGRPQHRAVAGAVAGVEAARAIREHYLDPDKRAEAGVRAPAGRWCARASSIPTHFYGTINCNGVNAKGEVCGVTTTSGLAWKIPGRVGDSPILGAGLYVDGDVGAAGSTGRGEANLYGLCSFLIVEQMRQGKTPEGRRASRRCAASRPTPSRSGCSIRRARATRTSA